MKYLIASVVILFTYNKTNAQNTFSKMYDIYGHWESFTNILSHNDDWVLAGISRNFFVSDSTRFNSLYFTITLSFFYCIMPPKLRFLY